MGPGIGDLDGAFESLAAPGVVVGDLKRGGVGGEFFGEAGEDHVVTFDAEPAFGLGIGNAPVGHAADADDGGKPFVEGLGEGAVGALEEVRRGLAVRAKEGFEFHRSHPRGGAHFVGHIGEVCSADPGAGVPAGFCFIEPGGFVGVAFDDGDDFRCVGIAGDFFEGLAPFFATRAKGVKEAGRAAGVAAGAELTDGGGVGNGRAQPVGLGEEREGEKEPEANCPGSKERGR